MPTKILVIGPSSIHVSRFIDLVKDLFDEVVYVGESRLETHPGIRQHLISFRSGNPFAIWKNYRRLKRVIAEENPTITHMQQVNRQAYMASRILGATGRPGVVTAWGSDVLLVPKKHWIFRRMTVDVLNKAAFITADSNHMIAEINRLTANRNCRLVFFGIDPIKGLPKENFIYSNRALQELYNIEGIIHEFDAFQKNHPEWRLVVAGTGKRRAALEELVKTLGLSAKIEFVGWLTPEQNNGYYQRAAIYISLPFSDGTSISLLEAMSAGCIPVVSDLPVAYEWIENGKTGIIKKEGENSLEQALLLNIPEMQASNAAVIEEKATRKIATRQFKEIYDHILDDRPAKK